VSCRECESLRKELEFTRAQAKDGYGQHRRLMDALLAVEATDLNPEFAEPYKKGWADCVRAIKENAGLPPFQLPGRR
jgi:hypothetical protein